MQPRGSRRAESRESTIAEFRRIFHDRRKRKLHRSLVPLCTLPLRTTRRQLFPRIAFSSFFPQRKAERLNEQKGKRQYVHYFIHIHVYMYIPRDIYCVIYSSHIVR